MRSIVPSPKPGRRARGVGRILAALTAAAALCLAACNSPTGGSTEAEGVRLSGRVLGTSGAPVPGVVVTAARSGLFDTTDALGRFVLSAKTAEPPIQAAVLDTLRFVKHGQSLAKVNVTSWIEELPDIQVIQRNIVGTLELGALAFGRVEFVLTGDGIDSSAPIVTPVYYNALANNYSGFAYFPPSPSVQNYAVYINVYGPDSALLGRSQTVPFNSFAGDITVPAFSPTNAYPVADAGGNRTVAVGASVALSGTASDSFGGSIVKWEWSIDGGPFRRTATGDTVIIAPSARANAYACVLRVTDDEGNVGTSTAFLTVTNDAPVISGLADTLVVGLNASVNFSVTATDSQGVVRYLWDLDGDGLDDDSTLAGTKAHVFPGTTGLSRVIVTARDAYDGVRKDTAMVFRLPGAITWTPRASGVTKLLKGLAWTGSEFLVTADTGLLLASPNGTSWTPRVLAAGRSIGAVASSGSGIVALSRYVGTAHDSSIHVSTNGTTWTSAMDTLFRATQPLLLEHLGGRYLAYVSPGPSLLVSSDGVDWTRGLVSFANGADGRSQVAWNGSEYLSVQSSGFVLKSLDGVTWTTPPATGLPNTTNYSGLVWVGDRYVVNANNQVYQSLDGLAWISLSTRTVSLIKALGVNGMIVGVTNDGKVAVSPDKGVHWLVRQVAEGPLRNLAWNGSRFVAVGASGAILTSD